MEQELEIEYKNLLTKDEYQKLLVDEFTKDASVQKIMQTNHYFDTPDKLLRKYQSALRIRRLDTRNELTFKVPAQEFLMESNFSLNQEQTDLILTQKQFSLSDITNKRVDLKVPGLTNETTFEHFNQFTTVRYEKKVGDHLMVLDQTTFQNDVVDYELEVESIDPLDGKNFFNSLLEKHSIPSRSTLPKIARAENNR